MAITIIAEAGVNHNGDIRLAKEMIKKAKEAGANYIKFQTFVPENLVSKDTGKAQYQKEATGSQESQLEMLSKLALTFEDFAELKKCCEAEEIGFISTPFDLDSIAFLNTLDMPFWKVPSGDITNEPYLREIGRTGKPVVLSTGMSTLGEVGEAIRVLREEGTTQITLLHCTTQYPTPMEEVNLAAMETLKNTFQLPVGYSDHTQGIIVPVAAAALGAVVVEKHFTLDRSMEGPDHKASLEPDELKTMVDHIRQIELAIGTGIKMPSPSERGNMVAARKSLVAATAIKEGEPFTPENLTAKRPGDGLSPMNWSKLLGKPADKDYQPDEKINSRILQRI